jgi:CoA:oxalate CoA-transferase
VSNQSHEDLGGQLRNKPPFGGLLVLDLTQIYNGPYATFLLAQAGATVIKIEPPDGEHLRKRADSGVQAVTVPYAMLNANKLSMSLNLKKEKAREVFLSLVEKADILVENFTPDAMHKLGLSAERLLRLNPRLIYASSSGYGKTGPYREYPAMDLAVQAMSGVIGVTGYQHSPPVKAGVALCDFNAGIHLYGAICTALYQREKTGLGDIVEVSMMEAIYPSLASNLGAHHAGDHGIKRTGNRHGGMSLAPYNVYGVEDGHVAIITSNEKHWLALVKALNLQNKFDLTLFATQKQRSKNMEALDALIETLTQEFTKKQLLELLREHRVPCAPVQELDDVVNDEHLLARGTLQKIKHPIYGDILINKSPLKFTNSVAPDYIPSVPLGNDTDHILETILGLKNFAIEQLKNEIST